MPSDAERDARSSLMGGAQGMTKTPRGKEQKVRGGKAVAVRRDEKL